jgi:mannose-6-phosphate isomerase-like protein (cupin superfamily)
MDPTVAKAVAHRACGSLRRIGCRSSETRFIVAFEHGTLSVEIYAPHGADPQQPHARDEAYVVVSGSGTFAHGDRRDPFGPGDFLFVPAGMIHRFEAFTEDLVVWVVFYG